MTATVSGANIMPIPAPVSATFHQMELKLLVASIVESSAKPNTTRTDPTMTGMRGPTFAAIRLAGGDKKKIPSVSGSRRTPDASGEKPWIDMKYCDMKNIAPTIMNPSNDAIRHAAVNVRLVNRSNGKSGSAERRS